MNAFFGNLVFLNPWLLAALAALPALWFLLRIMPPAPKRVLIPTARFLQDLVPQTQTPSKTPWWILLMRLLITGLVITAFAQPVLNPSQQINKNDSLRIVVDNGWSSAHLWDTKIKTAEDYLAQASRAGVSVYLHTTAPETGEKAPLALGPLSADEALSRLKGLSPHPWPADYAAASKLIQSDIVNIRSVVLSDGINGKNFETFIKNLKSNGEVHILNPASEDFPIVLANGKNDEGNPGFTIYTPETMPAGTPLSLQGIGQNGRVLGIENIVLEHGAKKTNVTLKLPDILRRDLMRVRIAERQSAGSVYVLGDQFQKKRVGIASPVEESEATPFIEASFYLTRALGPYADLKTGDLDSLLSANLSLIILPDIGALSPIQLNRLEDWVKNGGLLLRFAGPAMEQVHGEQFLMPVPLRRGKRSTDGALAWEKSPKLLSFAEHSPLAGISIHEDVIIRQQLLAEPTEDLPEKTWASLDDGTPLITAERIEDGFVVMVHTSASPDWSNLPLSGVFVQILSRLVKIAGSAPDTFETITGMLAPLRVMDGFGQMIEPDSSAEMIAAADFETTLPSSTHPPGIYGQGSSQQALNIGAHVTYIEPLPDFGAGVSTTLYDLSYETNLMPPLLLAALLILLLDWAVMIVLSGHFRMRQFARTTTAVFAVAFFALSPLMLSPARADIPAEFKYADGLYLGYMQSANTSVNAQARAGLEALSEELTRRTSAEPDGVVGLNPETDILAFFPLIYWAIDAADKPLSEKAIKNVQSYLDHGGTILFDTREPTITSDPMRGGANAQALASITQGLNIPALAPISDNHVLGRSFYLLDAFPGKYQGGTFWIEGKSASGRDGVSSVLIGNHDWASAWAETTDRNYRTGTAARQREMAVRFGVNVMMYALTGNYKADQIHVQNILERLGQ